MIGLDLGHVHGALPGPTLVFIAGLHGNEPAGVEACRLVLDRLSRRAPRSGEVVAFAGNPAALAAGRRFLLRDQNRQWTPDGLAAARRAKSGTDSEAAALAELAAGLDEVLSRARGPVFAIDLHTTSAEGVPFSITSQTDTARRFAEQLVVPSVAGLAERISGTLSGYLDARGCVTLAVEGGEHRSAAAAANLEAVIALSLVATGLFEPGDVPGYEDARARLLRQRGDLPPMIEVDSRHEVRPESGFRMEPGFANIHPTPEGTLLAREQGTDIRAPFDGFVLLPLYQEQGEDGFFYGRERRG